MQNTGSGIAELGCHPKSFALPLGRGDVRMRTFVLKRSLWNGEELRLEPESDWAGAGDGVK